MALVLLYEKQVDSRTPALEVDLIVSADLSVETTATDNPVEEGADVTDHVVSRPDVVRVEAIVSDRLQDGTLQEGRARAAWETLQDLSGDGVLLDLVTPLAGIYENVLLLSLNAKLDATTGESFLRFSATFREVRFGQSEQVAAPVRKEPKTKPTKDDGYKPPKLVYAHTADRGRTALRTLGDYFTDRNRVD